MASSYYTNTLHVNFESVLAMDDPGMVSMFQALMASSLEGFLGCPAVIYEAALVDFFVNASVRDGMVVSTVHGVTVEFSEQLFAETFELPLEGLSELSEIPKDLVFDARSIVSLSGGPVSMSGKKKEMKFEYRLLYDILAKTISVKAGSFDALTMEKFLMLTAIICEVNINWNMDIKIPGVDERTWYLASIPQIRVDHKGKDPLMEKDRVKGNPVKEQVLLILANIECLVQLREKIIDDVDRFFNSFRFKKLASLKVEDISAKEELVLSWGETESTRVALNRRMYILTKYRELLIRKFLKARKMNFAPGDGSSAVDLQVLDRLSNIHSFVLEELKEQMKAHGLMWKKTCCSKIFEGRPRDRGAPNILSLRLSQFCTVSVRYSLLNGLSIADICSFVSSIVFERTALRDVHRIQRSIFALPSVQSSSVSVSSQNVQLAFSSVVEDEDNQMDIDQRLASPTTTADYSMNFSDNDILLGDDATPNQPSLPTVSNLSTYLDVFRTLLWQRLDAQSEDIRHIGDSHNDVLSRLNTLDKGLRDALLQQGEDLRKLIQNVLQDGRTLDDVQTLRFNEFRKGFLAHSAVVTADSMDFGKEFRERNAKVTSLDEQVAATRNDLLEFSAQAQETLNHITDQLSELIAYINRGGNDKKGEVNRSSPQPPPDDQNRGSGNTGGDNARTTDIVDRLVAVKEQVLLILANIECLVQLREKIIDDVDRFFNSFSFKKLASLKVEDIFATEELVLSWGEAESTRVALNRRMYILTKYRELLIRKFLEARKMNFAPDDGASAVDLKVLDRLSDIHSFVLENRRNRQKHTRLDKSKRQRLDKLKRQRIGLALRFSRWVFHIIIYWYISCWYISRWYFSCWKNQVMKCSCVVTSRYVIKGDISSDQLVHIFRS
ncbi:dystroglycan-like [Dorcoceras hygrometricum]|uniref:Dystroglycan-like n=1 Tax=Dorcoceras hygrometricum TaxID=472368 RepID=A0A2Z7D699_9LAMI|nr:dystroglycan-like [Dorcoceras hygrometricum]